MGHDDERRACVIDAVRGHRPRDLPDIRNQSERIDTGRSSLNRP
jgi:hypothetical protein